MPRHQAISPACSVAWFAVATNALTAALTAAAILMYVVGYTLLLKRRTPQNIVWGGAAGCMPVLIGWSAVTGSLAWPPIVLFLIVFFWTPPHYWPLSMRFKDQYAAAGVPMLPVVAHDVSVARQVVIYTWATVACSLVLIPVAGMGWIYLASAVLAGALFPRDLLPGPLYALSNCLPVSHALDALRASLLGAATLRDTLPAIALTLAVSAVYALVGALSLRKVEHAAKRSGDLELY